MAVVMGLLRWGKANGATVAHLSVVPANRPALTLYEKIGFREVYQYRYYVR
jgi:ribosomal protein S18 acetylase RimI-like enzyme